MPPQDLTTNVGFLSILSAGDLQTLLTGAKRLPFHKDQDLLRQGQRNGSLFIVQEGLLHVLRAAGGKQVFLGRLEPGAFFGELSLVDPGPTTATVHAASDGVLVEISRECLDAFTAAHPAAGVELLRRMLQDVAHRLRSADERLSESVVWGGLLRGSRQVS